MARRNPRQSKRRNVPNDAVAPLPQNPNHFLNRFPSYSDYSGFLGDHPNQTGITRQQYAGLSPRRRRQGGGGGGGGGGQSQQPLPDFSQPPSSQPSSQNIPPIIPPASGGVNPFLGNTSYSGEFTNANPGSGNYLESNIPVVAGIGQGSYAPAGAGGSADVFTYDTFAGGHTYEPMPGGATSGPGNANYPFSGYAAPPSNVGYFDQGNGWDFGNTNHTPMAWSQYAQVLGAQNDLQPYFQQKLAPPNAQGVWWSNPVVTDPGYYDPWVELRNLQQHFGDAEAGNVAASKALGTYASPQGQLDYYRYLAHQANIPGYAQMTGPLAVGYHSPNVGGTYGAPATYG